MAKKASSKKVAKKTSTRSAGGRGAAPAKKTSRSRAAALTSQEVTILESQGGAEGLEKVRDLLFGNQVRESEKRFARLEERLAADVKSLHEEVARRFDSLEQYVRSEIESVVTRLKDEQKERTAAVKSLTKELADAAKSLESRVDKVDEQSHGQLARSDRQAAMLMLAIEGEQPRPEHLQIRSRRAASTDESRSAASFGYAAAENYLV